LRWAPLSATPVAFQRGPRPGCSIGRGSRMQWNWGKTAAGRFYGTSSVTEP